MSRLPLPPGVPPPPRWRPRRPARPSLTGQEGRDGTLFVFGVGIVVYEIFVAPAPRWEALAFATTLLGLPHALRK